jgi:hypothetical protein
MNSTIEPEPRQEFTVSVGFTTEGMVMALFLGNKQANWRKCSSTCLEYAEAEAEAVYPEAVAINGCPVLKERNFNEPVSY